MAEPDTNINTTNPDRPEWRYINPDPITEALAGVHDLLVDTDPEVFEDEALREAANQVRTDILAKIGAGLTLDERLAVMEADVASMAGHVEALAQRHRQFAGLVVDIAGSLSRAAQKQLDETTAEVGR